ncbi:hypothetical protein SCLCIDRAFT_111758 [Scleroderma citrinum Foug A]|uniref:Uncharacterized protein n=1 Tax=Scleroderma citrinum Foug A TaxID=1036808 RepID=A0A0C3ALM5_9AGAM|nr:hypothetical protein SCLCIDRAFT_111758 [Scleroderma citrinum Foug A]
MAQPSDHINNDSTLGALKHRVATLEKENRDLHSAETSSRKTREEFYHGAGRAIRRVVMLYDHVEDLVNESDHRACLEQDISNNDPIEHSLE